MTAMFRKTALALPLLAALHAGAAEVADMVYRPDEATPAPKALVQGCAVEVTALVDGRNNRETIGRIDITESVLAGDMLPWMKGATNRLAAYGYQVGHGGSPRPGAAHVEVRLTRAYTFLANGPLGGMVAVEVTAAGYKPLKLRQISYKARRNWGGAANHVAVLNAAMDGIVAALAGALKPVCAGLPPG